MYLLFVHVHIFNLVSKLIQSCIPCYSVLRTCFQHVSFDYLNLCLADYELNIDSFTAYRSRQLQAPRLSLIDTESFIRGDLVAESLAEDSSEKDKFLSDLVRHDLEKTERVQYSTFVSYYNKRIHVHLWHLKKGSCFIQLVFHC